ncbi:flavodoxin domain-containing protein [bacterium]|nr:flavodoxin domain-containing protein [bacterium]
MGRILVLYDSGTGNTKAMAGLVAAGARKITGMTVTLREVSEASKEDILACDGIAVGSPTHTGLLSWKMKRFWDEEMHELWGKIDGKIGCAFSSSWGWGGGNELACASILAMLINFGFLVFGVPDYVDSHFTLHYGAVVAGKPMQAYEKAACSRLGERLASWVSVMADGKPVALPKKE